MEGNLILQDTMNGNIVWRTNTSLLNVYPDGAREENIKFFLAANTLYIIEDKYPSAAGISPNILWSAGMNDTAMNLELIITNNGYMILSTKTGTELWMRPYALVTGNMETTDSNIELDKNATIISGNGGSNTKSQGSGNNQNTTAQDLVWLWVILALLIAFSISFLCHRKYKGRYDNFSQTASGVTTNEIRRLDEELSEDTELKEEDLMINDWIAGTATPKKNYTEGVGRQMVDNFLATAAITNTDSDLDKKCEPEIMLPTKVESENPVFVVPESHATGIWGEIEHSKDSDGSTI